MWSSRLIRTALGIALVSLALAGCTATPLYGTGSQASATLLTYAEPTTRLEQVIYNELNLRLPGSSQPGARRVTVSVGLSAVTEALSQTVNPNKLQAVTVTATATLAPAAPGTEPVALTRFATAQYTTNDQALATQEAAIEAQERAARAAADALRLALLAELSRQ